MYSYNLSCVEHHQSVMFKKSFREQFRLGYVEAIGPPPKERTVERLLSNEGEHRLQDGQLRFLKNCLDSFAFRNLITVQFEIKHSCGRVPHKTNAFCCMRPKWWKCYRNTAQLIKMHLKIILNLHPKH